MKRLQSLPPVDRAFLKHAGVIPEDLDIPYVPIEAPEEEPKQTISVRYIENKPAYMLPTMNSKIREVQKSTSPEKSIPSPSPVKSARPKKDSKPKMNLEENSEEDDPVENLDEVKNEISQNQSKKSMNQKSSDAQLKGIQKVQLNDDSEQYTDVDDTSLGATGKNIQSRKSLGLSPNEESAEMDDQFESAKTPSKNANDSMQGSYGKRTLA